jgi:hypothetical protein
VGGSSGETSVAAGDMTIVNVKIWTLAGIKL